MDWITRENPTACVIVKLFGFLLLHHTPLASSGQFCCSMVVLLLHVNALNTNTLISLIPIESSRAFLPFLCYQLPSPVPLPSPLPPSHNSFSSRTCFLLLLLLASSSTCSFPATLAEGLTRGCNTARVLATVLYAFGCQSNDKS